MIRERREQDLDRLCAVLQTLAPPPASLRGVDPRRWLEEHDAERSWVFDQAPVSVTPTRNVIGHVQIYRPTAGPGRPDAGERLVIGRLFVQPGRHAEGIGRFLLRESLRHVRARGSRPAVDLRENGFPAGFFEQAGFRVDQAAEPAAAVMVHPG